MLHGTVGIYHDAVTISHGTNPVQHGTVNIFYILSILPCTESVTE